MARAADASTLALTTPATAMMLASAMGCRDALAAAQLELLSDNQAERSWLCRMGMLVIDEPCLAEFGTLSLPHANIHRCKIDSTRSNDIESVLLGHCGDRHSTGISERHRKIKSEVTFTRAIPFSGGGLTSFVHMVQSELASLLEMNQRGLAALHEV